MESVDFENLTPEMLKRFIDRHTESSYRLIDVRQPDEYEVAHIPGARLMPLPQLEGRLYELPEDQDLIFYCRSGARSAYAAALAIEGEVTRKTVAHLKGGMLAWNGKTLTDFPRVEVFDAAADLPTLLLTAIGLEKGAFRFYTSFLEGVAPEALRPTLVTLSKAEEIHARMVYSHLAEADGKTAPFETLYAGLKGDILEGGQTFDELANRFSNMSGDLCLNIIEIALSIELAAFDLYRVMAERTTAPPARSTFLDIAQAEKGHMRMLSRAVEHCRRID
ncbi:MAG: rhodanese-like domain-containing protein [Thermodesulfobacteriota bacterium]|nr:rhodanese-like domain-containing protein [Thermodesulfobacteriota bacterium]